jgi:SET domain-containing protein
MSKITLKNAFAGSMISEFSGVFIPRLAARLKWLSAEDLSEF